jgi:hypothetical protein
LDKGYKIIIASIIFSLSLVVCAFILKDAYISKSVPQSIPYISADLSQLRDALVYDDVMLLEEAGYYLGYSNENMGEFRSLVGYDKIPGLPYTKLSGKIVFSKKALDEWLYNATKQNYESP